MATIKLFWHRIFCKKRKKRCGRGDGNIKGGTKASEDETRNATGYMCKSDKKNERLNKQIPGHVKKGAWGKTCNTPVSIQQQIPHHLADRERELVMLQIAMSKELISLPPISKPSPLKELLPQLSSSSEIKKNLFFQTSGEGQEKPTVPEIPKPTIPEIPKPALPELPKPELPTLPKPEVPKVPEIHDLPKPTLPTIPELPKDFPIPSLPHP
ncbi:hypothetical protein Ccrd_019865 [Cynara cardunculus var. scolymus]|uniref:Hydroxyproline-rich glycoprotein family protein n=1 Tax=Cynara cardunculus var. scolymus TaxID=59895 RepID=A0A103Y3J9_CYNCS|nr:hypothetical protein Ccrd_019865 [Cynara cardunculus var. scolymus]